MTTYTVTVTREDDLWVALVDGLPRHLIGAADYDSFTTLHDEVPWLIADLTDTGPDDFTVTYRYTINGQDITREVQQFMDAEKAARAIATERDRARDAALHALTDAGLSRRVVADVVDLSHQRVQQLLKAS